MSEWEQKLLEAAALDECFSPQFLYLVEIVKRLRDAQKLGYNFCDIVRQGVEQNEDSLQTVRKYVRAFDFDVLVSGVAENKFYLKINFRIMGYTPDGDIYASFKAWEIRNELHCELKELAEFLSEDYEHPPEINIEVHDMVRPSN